jgi:hypothetical protein
VLFMSSVRNSGYEPFKLAALPMAGDTVTRRVRGALELVLPWMFGK